MFSRTSTESGYLQVHESLQYLAQRNSISEKAQMFCVLKWNVLGVLPSREVADAFDATDAPPVFTEDLKEALVCLRDGKLWANGDHLGGQF